MGILQKKPQNIAVQTSPANDLRLVECDIPKIRPDECLVHVRATGICGSDVHFWKHGHIGPMIVTGDNGLGHESAGVVVEVGESVTRFKPGKSAWPVCYPLSFLSAHANTTGTDVQAIASPWNAECPAPKQPATSAAQAAITPVQRWSFSRHRRTTGLCAVTMLTQKRGCTRSPTTSPSRKGRCLNR